jgi:type IV pilus assembly protein PilW
MHMTGYDPAGTTSSGITSASANSITFTQDQNGDNDVVDANENITYSYDSGNLRINRNTGGGAQPYAENVEALNFSYYDAAGATTATLASIRKIKIEIRTRTARKDPNYSTNSGYRTYTLTSYVTPRNLAY